MRIMVNERFWLPRNERGHHTVHFPKKYSLERRTLGSDYHAGFFQQFFIGGAGGNTEATSYPDNFDSEHHPVGSM